MSPKGPRMPAASNEPNADRAQPNVRNVHQNRLTLTRRPGEGIVLRTGNTEIRIRLGTHDHLTVEAPATVEVLREELA